MGVEIFIRLPELALEAQPTTGLEYPNASSAMHLLESDVHFTIWGSPKDWDNLSRWAHECAEVRRKALAEVGDIPF